MTRNVHAKLDAHISRKYEFLFFIGFQPKVLGNYTHFFGFCYRLGAAAGVELSEDI